MGMDFKNTVQQLENAFAQNFELRGELGASLSVWRGGEELLSLSRGWCERDQQRVWTEETMVPIYSATKGPASFVLLEMLEENGMCPESRVQRVWPEFPHASATFAMLLSHQCGLAKLDEKVSVFDYEAVIDVLEKQELNWSEGQHGYHPRTFGFLLDECVRRLTGERLGKVWHERYAQPYDLDIWIGLPKSEQSRVATLYAGKMQKVQMEDGFYKAFLQGGTLVHGAFMSPRGLHGVHEMNTPKAWEAALPAMGGVATARGLAKFYQLVIGQLGEVSADVRAWMEHTQVMGEDLILCTPTHFSCGFQKDPIGQDGQKTRRHYGSSLRAFGHPGAGGSHAFGDPEHGVSFAYVMNQMDLSVLPGRKGVSLVEALYDSPVE